MDNSIYTIAPTRRLDPDCRSCERLQKQVWDLEKLIKVGVTLPSHNTVKTVKTLQKRAQWLEARCAVRESSGQNAGYDESELAALKWAILCINAAVQFGVLLPEASDPGVVQAEALGGVEL